MRFSEVKERHLYYVNFNQVRGCEFDGNHLVVVLKKNNDKKTAIVMPLTSKPNGLGTNKLLIDPIADLPERLKVHNSYAVYDQVRTVNFNRFEPIYKEMNGHEEVTVKIDDSIFMELILMGTGELEKKLVLEEKLILYKQKLNNSINEKIINLAYELIKSQGNEEEVKRIKEEIRVIIMNKMEYKFTDKEKEDGIQNIINSIIDL